MAVKDILKIFKAATDEQLEELILKYIDEPIFFNFIEYIDLFRRYFKMRPDIRLLYLMLHKRIGLHDRFIYEEMARIYKDYNGRVDISIAFLELGIENRVFDRNILHHEIEVLRQSNAHNSDCTPPPSKYIEPIFLEYFDRVWFDYRSARKAEKQSIEEIRPFNVRDKICVGSREYFINEEIAENKYSMFIIYNYTASINTDTYVMQIISSPIDFNTKFFLAHEIVKIEGGEAFGIIYKESQLKTVGHSISIISDRAMLEYILYIILDILIHLDREKIFLKIDLMNFQIIEDGEDDLKIKLNDYQIQNVPDIDIRDLLIKCKLEDISDFSKLYYIIKNRVEQNRENIMQLVSNIKLEIYSKIN